MRPHGMTGMREPMVRWIRQRIVVILTSLGDSFIIAAKSEPTSRRGANWVTTRLLTARGRFDVDDSADEEDYGEDDEEDDEEKEEDE